MRSLCLKNAVPVAKGRFRESKMETLLYSLLPPTGNYIRVCEMIHRHFNINSFMKSSQRETKNLDAMVPETECGICYRTYNAGRRCPRQLNCKHAFCESCLLTLAGVEPRIACPLCRQYTPLSEGTVRDNLPVDEDIFKRLVNAGNSEKDADDDENTEEPEQDKCDPPKEDASSPPTRSRKGRMMKFIRRMSKKITGRRNCVSDEDLRDLAMMSCLMM